MRGEDKHKHHHHHNHHHHRLLSFHFHMHFHMPHLGHGHGHGHGHEHGHGPKKGWIGVRVGQEGEEQQRFVVPVEYLNHPLFLGLLDQAREEYGFEHQGAITIPCGVDYFRHVRGIIDRDTTAHHHHLPHFAGCFRA